MPRARTLRHHLPTRDPAAGTWAGTGTPARVRKPALRGAAGAALLAIAALAAPARAAGPQATAPAAAPTPQEPGEPRAFGYTVGDVVERRVWLDLPPGTTVDPASLPSPGGRGKALELRSVSLQGRELRLAYQVFLAPTELRVLEMPPVQLQLLGGPRPLSLRVDAWPLSVAPLTAESPSPRRGLGELRPDTPPMEVDTTALRHRLAVWTLVALLPLGWLLHVYVGLPFWQRRHRPFGQAWQVLRGLPAAPTAEQRRTAWEQVHAALNRTAGEVVFEAGLERFLAAHPRFARLRGDWQQFFQRSRAEFFAGAGQPGDAAWLQAFCRSCRDAERGAPR